METRSCVTNKRKQRTRHCIELLRKKRWGEVVGTGEKAFRMIAVQL